MTGEPIKRLVLGPEAQASLDAFRKRTASQSDRDREVGMQLTEESHRQRSERDTRLAEERRIAQRRRRAPRPTGAAFEAAFPIHLAMPGVPRPFNPSNEPGTCLWCGDPLRANWRSATDDAETPRGYGEYLDNGFCSLRCGHAFGVTLAGFGRRLQVTKEKA